MQPISKKMKRIERKKKKLAALIEITEMNNKDRVELDSSPTHRDQSIMEVSETTITENDKDVIDSSISLSKSDNDTVNDKNIEDINKNHSKHKKKRKSKHQEEHNDALILRKQKAKVENIFRDEWPVLSSKSNLDSYRHKRKSSFESEIQKERPLKMVKRHSEGCYQSPQNSEITSSFTDELMSLKKDIERNKQKKEKKSRSKDQIIDKQESNSELHPVKEPPTKISSGHCGEGDHSESIELANQKTEDEEIAELHKLMKERKKQLKEIPMVRLKGIGKEADLDLVQRTPILPCDVQNLLLLAQLGHDCPRFPRWLELKKYNRLSKTVVIVVEGASAYNYFSQESTCPMLQKMDVKAEMVSPYRYNASVVEELCAVPLTRQQKKELEKRFGKEICPEALLTDRVIKVLRSAFSISSVPKTQNEAVEQKISVPSTDKFPRTELLLSAWQLIEEGYPLPYDSTSDLGNRYPDYVMTKDLYAEVTPSSPMWALDCEMCLTKAGNELTRVSVVNEQHETVYESFCLPRNPIKNYLTEFSGITPEMLKGVTTRLEDIQQDLRQLFPPDVILVGQSLGSDLHALKMMHPYVIDTSVVFNLTGNRRHKSKLSMLTMEFLKEAIQQRGKDGHDSVEDSLAALKLVQLKLTKSIEYGDAVLSRLTNLTPTLNETSQTPNGTINYPEHHAGEFDDLKVEVGPTMATSLFKHITMRKKNVLVVGQEEILAEYSSFVAAAHRENKQLIRTQTTNSNNETIEVVCNECKKNNFTMAHLVLNEEDNLSLVDSWMKQVFDSPPFNSLFILVLTGGHANNSNGACIVTVKKPNLKLKSRKTD